MPTKAFRFLPSAAAIRPEMAFDAWRNGSLSRCAYRAVLLPSRAISEACKLQGRPEPRRARQRLCFARRLPLPPPRQPSSFPQQKPGCRQCTLRLRPSECVVVGDMIDRARRRSAVLSARCRTLHITWPSPPFPSTTASSSDYLNRI